MGDAAKLFRRLRDDGIDLRMLNLGGGFPTRYRTDVPATEAYADAVMKAVTRHFGNDLPDMIVEPGRALAGAAGVIQAEVVLISRKDYADRKRWVYLDIGKFGGLAETMDEAIKYPIVTERDGSARPARSSSPARPATAPTSSTRTATTGCRSISRSATRWRSSAPAPTPRPTPRSASTALRRCRPIVSSAESIGAIQRRIVSFRCHRRA